eukprot:CAMPEP_0196230986 /NCGR_PEP_ID=MMETSP0913-20130531/1984_1 /TAXON_ID=49265 /ORGANISM="Thalassiosira rotula, Strain GSO102" /LENGTH=397 /DNA_ID=CAMNT_0041511113 /DNA_START=45 /DNA_END=1238 /DNA_ORIENTATION=-
MLIKDSGSRGRSTISTIVIIVVNSVFLLTLQQLLQFSFPANVNSSNSIRGGGAVTDGDFKLPTNPTTVTAGASNQQSSPFGYRIPQGTATALPSIPITSEEETTIKRTIYGGKGDKAHLGGFTSFDPMGVSPTLWTHMISHLGVKTLLDLGCGRGISTSWFVLHGLEYVVCAEGSHDAVTQSLLPGLKDDVTNKDIVKEYDLVEHDFSRGPWWPERTVDVAWCIEFTEHVGRNYIHNYHTAFRKAALIFVSHSNWGGWHHVEVHDDEWWITKMASAGFVFSQSLTKEMRDKSQLDRQRLDLVNDMKKPNATTYNVGQHLWGTMQVFINPLVASLPEHAHLFAEHGCYARGQKGNECGKAGTGKGSQELTPLPESFKPLNLTQEMDNKWFDLIKDLPI